MHHLHLFHFQGKEFPELGELSDLLLGQLMGLDRFVSLFLIEVEIGIGKFLIEMIQFLCGLLKGFLSFLESLFEAGELFPQLVYLLCSLSPLLFDPDGGFLFLR